MNDNFSKSNLLITFNYPNHANDIARIDIENEIRAEIFAIMAKYKAQDKVRGFVIADDDIITDKLKNENELEL